MFRSIRPAVLLVLAVAVACTDQPTEPISGRAFTIDSAAIVRPTPLFASGATSGHANMCDWYNCPNLIFSPDSERTLFQSLSDEFHTPQLEPWEMRLLKPSTNVVVNYWGHIPCPGQHGVVDAFGVNDAPLGSFPLTLDDPADCGEDEITGRASVLIPGPQVVTRLVVHPPSPLVFPMPEAFRIYVGYPPGSLIYGEAFVNVSFDWAVQTKSHLKIFFPPTVPRLGDSTPLILPDGIRRSATAYDSSKGRPPQWNGEFWPDTAFIGITIDSAGTPIAGRTVRLRIFAVDSAGRSIDSVFGHAHSDPDRPKPAGSLKRTELLSLVTGRDSTRYYPSQVSGPIVIVATSEGADTATDTLWVGVHGLQRVVPSAHYDTTGGNAQHPFGMNVWVTSNMLDTLGLFADSVFAVFSRRAIFNDASLPYGGKFDLHDQWDGADTECQFTRNDGTKVASPAGCHQNHRTGWDTDLKTTGQFDGRKKDANFRRLMGIWTSLSCSLAFNEGNHIHLALREGGRLYDNKNPDCKTDE